MDLQLPIYLDYMATTPVDPKVAQKMSDFLLPSGTFGNPASHTHKFGYEAQQAVQTAKEQVAALINADPREIVWTSGATESDNLAIKGIAEFYQRQGKHIITMSTEHKAVLDTCKHLAAQGFEATFLNPEPNGILDLAKLKSAIRPDTILISIMHVNNETGVIQNIEAIGNVAREHGIVFHTDAAQSVGKLPIDVKILPVDLISFSGHKIYGPKGIGALYVRRKPRVRLSAQMHGGGHQGGMRSGTLPTHQIVGMGEAFRIAKENMAQEHTRIKKLRDNLWAGIQQAGNVHLNGHPTERVAGCLNVMFNEVDGESLLLSLKDIAVSTSSACNSANPAPSHVLSAMGLSAEQASRSIRFSVGRFTQEQEIEYVITHVTDHVKRLRELAPRQQAR